MSMDACLPTFPKTLWNTSLSSIRPFNCLTHDRSIRKLDRNSSSDMYIPSSNILSQLLSHCLYASREQYLHDFKQAKSVKMSRSISSSKLSSSSKHKCMKAFLTRCSPRASHSLMAIALLVSQALWRGSLMCVWFVRETKEKNNFFVNLRVLGWSMLLDFAWWSRKFPKMDSLKKNQKTRR